MEYYCHCQTRGKILRVDQIHQKYLFCHIDIIYEVCVNFKTDRKEDALIEYDAQTMFNDAGTSPVIPDHLLKKDDFKETYIAASGLLDTISDYTLEHNARNKQDDIDFANTNSLNQKVTIISVI